MISTFGAIASVLIAYFAYNIDIRVQENALKEGRIGRAVAVSQGIMKDPSVFELLLRANEIEVKAQEILNPPEVGFKQALIRANRKIDDEAKLRPHLTILVQYMEQLVNCMGLENGASLTNEELCDKKTVFALAGKALTELYVAFRPALFCDDFFANENHDPLVSFVESYWSYERPLSEDGSKIRIFREHDADAISKWQQENKDNPNNYRVIAFAKESCVPYSGHDAQLANAALNQ